MGGPYSYIRVLHNYFLLKSIVFTVFEHEYMNIVPLTYQAIDARDHTERFSTTAAEAIQLLALQTPS